MNDGPEWLVLIEEAERTLKSIEAILNELSDAFWATGNDRLAGSLTNLAKRIEGARTEYGDAINAITNEMFGSSQQAMISMLNAALAAIEKSK